MRKKERMKKKEKKGENVRYKQGICMHIEAFKRDTYISARKKDLIPSRSNGREWLKMTFFGE
jgi:hypothetical protein